MSITMTTEKLQNKIMVIRSIREREDFPAAFINNIPDPILIGLGGSFAYGTNTETSDIDVRGIYRNPLDELIGVKKDSEQITDPGSDTVIYSFKKMATLLANCNPNTIEILGLKDEHYLLLTDEGKLLLDQKDIFLSKRAIYTFGQYALSQLNRLINKSGRAQGEILANEQRSLSKAMRAMEERYHADRLKVTFNVTEDAVTTDFHAENMPITQLIAVMNELGSIHKDYSKSKRNDKAIEHNKLNKHMMHLLRLYMMGIDILEKHKIITYRAEEHDLLMDIRNSKYLESDNKTPTKEFTKIINDYVKRFDEAAKNTTLPDQPDYEKINELVMKINKMR